MPDSNQPQISYDDFTKVDIRVGQIIEVELIKNPKHSTHRLVIDFGQEIGQKVSCARLPNYSLEQLQGKYILGVVNFPARQIGQHLSETLTLGVPDGENECWLIVPDMPVGTKLPLGGRLY